MPIEALRTLLDAQRAAFARGAPAYRERMQALAALRNGLLARRDDLVAAVSADFGGRAAEETLMLEVFPVLDQIRHARRHLRRWMRRRRVPSSWFLLPSRAFVQYVPLGVVGVIGAWNYPVLLTLSPLVDALAAGNHALVKPSELTPRTAAGIAEILSSAFAPEYVRCVTGGPEVGRAFSALPLDHLCFTGSAEVGKEVMRAAAANLTPVTLELGGKSPAIVHESFPLALAVRRIMAGKLFNAGQTCVAPDYVLLPEALEAEFEVQAHRAAAQLYPRLRDNADYTRIVNHRQVERLRTLLEDAAAKGARVVPLASITAEDWTATRLVPPVLVFAPNDAMLLLQEEVFGPVLPVVSYSGLDEAIQFVNARPRPLALYYFDNDKGRVDTVLQRTQSGGVTINDCVYHLGQHNLPFGGVGASGMGQYHGFDGFVTFSKKRGVMRQRRWTITSLVHPPYQGRATRLIDALLRVAAR